MQSKFTQAITKQESLYVVDNLLVEGKISIDEYQHLVDDLGKISIDSLCEVEVVIGWTIKN